MLNSSPWYFLFIICGLLSLNDGLLEKKQHKTNASLERMNDLTCYRCSTLYDKRCQNVTLHWQNSTTGFHHICEGDKKICMVNRYSYSTSTTSANSSHVHHIKLWALERKCTNRCENGCIVIGERTKLYACTACCSTNLCNISNNANFLYFQKLIWFILNFTFIFSFK